MALEWRSYGAKNKKIKSMRTKILLYFTALAFVSAQILPIEAVSQVAQALDLTNVITEDSIDERPTYDLVAIVVDEKLVEDDEDYEGLQAGLNGKKYDDLDEDDLAGRIERYADDVRKATANTKVLMLPVNVNKDAVWQLQEVLERLYFEGDGESDERTQLRGIVLIGDVPLPVVNKNGNRFISLFPYTDFTDKSYIWNPISREFEYQSDVSQPQVEVWHGVIRAESESVTVGDAVVGGDAGVKMAREKLAFYFDKNHLYHTGHPDFTNFQKKILYSDLIRERENLNPTKFPLYENFLKNMEDLAYNRYTVKWFNELAGNFKKEFAEQISMIEQMTKSLDSDFSRDIAAISKKTGGKVDLKAGEKDKQAQYEAMKLPANGASSLAAIQGNQKNFVEKFKKGELDEGGMKDILSAPLIQKFHIPFVQVFGNYISKINDYIDSTGRWDTGDIDTVATLISKKDLIMQQFFLLMNTALESAIDERIQKIEKPLQLIRGVALRGRAGENVIGLAGGGLSAGGGADVSAGDPADSDEFVYFSNNSLISENSYVNGMRASELENAGQCSLLKGSTQVVKSVRALNPMTVNSSAMVFENQLDSRKIPSLGVTTRKLLSKEAESLMGGKFPYGEMVTDVFPGNTGAGNPVLQKGDVLLSLDGKKLLTGITISALLSSHYPGRDIANEMILCSHNDGTNTYENSCDADKFQGWAKPSPFSGLPTTDKDYAKVTYFRGDAASGREYVRKVALFDGNDRRWFGGCFGGNFSNPENCLPLASTRPVNDFSGVKFIGENGNGLPADEASSCFNFFPYASPNHDGQNSADIRDFIYYYESTQGFLASDNGSKKTDLPSVFPNLAAGKVYFLKKPLLSGGEAQFTLDDFFNLFGQMNGKDDNGNFMDTNGNGTADQMAWVDLNKNGELDLCPKEAPTDFLYKSNLSSIKGVPCSDMKPGAKSGALYSGEFIGGDYGVDEPGEKVNFIRDLATFSKEFLRNESMISGKFFATPRRKPIKSEQIAVLKALGLDTENLPSLIGSGLSDSDESDRSALQRETSDYWFDFNPIIEKQISSTVLHKEPTSQTLKAQFSSMTSDRLPIDDPRYVVYRGKDGENVKIIYPNVFGASNLETFSSSLRAMEKSLGMGSGELDKVLDLKNLKSLMEWKDLTLNEKHQRALEEYLNPEDSNSYEALYFAGERAGDGDGNSGDDTILLNFSGDAPSSVLDHPDAVFQKLSDGKTVTGIGVDVGGSAESPKYVKDPEKTKPDEVPVGAEFYGEPLSIFEFPSFKSPWFEGLQKWWDDIKKYFDSGEPDDVSFSDEEDSMETMAKKSGAAIDAIPKNLNVTSDTEVIKTGGVSNALVKATVSDEKGQVIDGQMLSFEISVDGPGEVLNLFDDDLDLPGLQVVQFSGTLFFSIRSTDKAGSVTVNVKVRYDSEEFSGSVKIESGNALKLSLSATEYSLPANETSQTTLTASLPVSYNGQISFDISDPTSGYFVNVPPSKMESGKASVLIRSTRTAGSIPVTVSVPGIDSISFPILALPLPAKRVRVSSEGFTAKAQLVDTSGNSVFSSALIDFRVTDATFDSGTFENAQKQITIDSVSGKAESKIFPTGKGGKVNVIVSSPGLESGFVTLNAPYSFNGKSLNAKVLYASLLGGNYAGGDFSGENPPGNSLAQNILFSGSTQAVTSLLSAPVQKKRSAFIRPDGGVGILDDRLGLFVSSANSGEPLRIEIRENADKNMLGNIFVVDGDAKIDLKNTTEFVVHVGDSVDDAGGGRRSILRGEQEVLRVNERGGITIFDSNISLQIANEAALGIRILYSGTEIGTVRYSFSGAPSVILKSEEADNGITLSKGVHFVPSNTFDEKYIAEKFFGEASTAGSSGIFLTSRLEEMEQEKRAGHSFTSLEDSFSSEAVGFRGDNKHMLLLAAGNTVGVSNLPYASEIGVVLGDPTVKLSGGNSESQIGFTKDIGTEIYSGTQPIQFVTPIDLNGNGQKHLLLGYENGEVKLLENTSGEPAFRDRGVYLSVKNGIFDAAAADIDNDGFEDFVVAARQGCTADEVCTDLYRNHKGFLVRENIPLAITEKIHRIRLKDMNLDGWIDLVTADSKGSVKIFLNDHGKFSQNGGKNNGKLLGSFGKSVLISVSETFPDLPKNQYPDVLVVSPEDGGSGGGGASGGNAGAKTTYYETSDGVNYKKIEKQSAQKIPDNQELAKDFLKNYPTPAANATGSVAQQKLAEQMGALTNEDSDSDGIPDSFDTTTVSPEAALVAVGGAGGGGEDSFDFASFSNDLAGGVEDLVASLKCSGGCLPTPINFAFFAPGPINGPLGTPVGFDSGLPVFGWGAPCLLWPIWPGCPYQGTAGGRLYLSPTLTMGLGFSVCLGPWLAGECYAFGVPVKALLGGICEEIAGGFSAVLEGAVSLASGGYDGAVAAYGSGSDFSPPTGSFSSSAELGSYQAANISGSSNIRVPGFPGFLVDWLDSQMEEALNKLADLPDLYLIYPSISSITGAFIPKIPKGKLSGFTQFLTYLNSIPLIKIEPREVEVRLPALTQAEINKFMNDIEQWKIDFSLQLEKIKNLWKCNKNPNLTLHESQLCNKIVVNADVVLKRLEETLQSLEAFKKFPNQLMDFRNIQTKYLRQIINYLDTITNFTGGYIQRQQKRVEQWTTAAQDIKNILNNWQAIIDITLEYEESCDECKTDRFSLLQLLIQIFVQIPTPPIIPFPKWPDIVMDFSKIQAGVTIIWPDISFTSAKVILPKLPRIALPDVFISGFSGFELLIDLNKLGLAFPVLPPPPTLPELPDLPPLPMFKLPDVPPAPKIPDIGSLPLLKTGLDVLKNILKIVCLIKTGLVPVSETILKTEIETLTQRSVSPPLSIDTMFKIESPKIEYDFIDQVIFEGRANFQVQTQFIYDIVKSFADLANSMTTNLIESANKVTKKVNGAGEKLSGLNIDLNSGPSEIRLIAEETRFIPEKFIPEKFENDAPENSSGQYSRDGYLPTLSRQLERYLAQNDKKNLHLTSRIFEQVPMKRFVADVSMNDTLEKYSSRMIAANPSVKNGGDGSGNAAGDGSGNGGNAKGVGAGLGSASNLANKLTGNAKPIGIFIQNPITHKTERMMNYVSEISSNTKILYEDFDSDTDSDAFIIFGNDLYLKDNGLKNTAKKPYSGSTQKISMNNFLPLLPSINGLKASYLENRRVSLLWKKSPFNPSETSLVGYEILMRSKTGLTKKRYFFENVSDALREKFSEDEADNGIPLEDISRDLTTLHFDLENGNHYLQIRPIHESGKYGTVSKTILLAPQICGDKDEPVISIGTEKKKVAILKTLIIPAISTDDDSEFFVDLDLKKDDNGDKDPTNDKNVNAGKDSNISLPPYTQAGIHTVKIWAVDAAGNKSGQEVVIEVYNPDIILEDVNTDIGTVKGHLNPVEPQMPFTLVRERGGSSSALGSYQTDQKGQFFIDNLNLEKKTVIKNSSGESVVEFDSDISKIKILPDFSKNGYVLVAEPATSTTPTMIHLISTHPEDLKGVILFSMFFVPDQRENVIIDPSNFSYDASSVQNLHGVHLKDLSTIDAFEVKKSGDPQYGGGQEIIYSNEAARVALVDSLGRIFIFDPRVKLKVKENGDSDPYVFELVFENTPRIEVFIATGKKPVQFVDSVKFDEQKPFSFDQNVSVQVSTSQTAAATSSASPAAQGFSDVLKNSPYYSVVKDLQQKGIIEGYQDGDNVFYKPDQLISRAEFTKITLKALCIVPRPDAYNPPSPFNDIFFTQPPEWFYPWVKESYLLQLITGYLGKEIDKKGFAPFKPQATITRAESAKILLEALRFLDVLTLDVQPQDPKIGPWYETYLELSQDLSPHLKNAKTPQSFLLTPQESFSPNEKMTRGEFAIMTGRVLRAYNCFENQQAAGPSPSSVTSDSGSPGSSSPPPSGVSTSPSGGSFTGGSAGGTGEKNSQYQQLLQNFGPGKYGILPPCISCPCLSTIEQMNDFVSGDKIFAVFADTNLAHIYQKSNVIVIP